MKQLSYHPLNYNILPKPSSKGIVMKCTWISHPLSATTPGYAGKNQPIIEDQSVIAKGASCNSLMLQMTNHSGSHVDAPRHFIEKGKSITDYEAQQWVFNSPYLVDIEVPFGTLIKCEEIAHSLTEVPEDTDLLCFRTGMERWRHQEEYWANGPGLAGEIVQLLERFKQLEAIALDTISISSLKHREAGREAHKAFLGKGIRIFEDMKLSVLDPRDMPGLIIGCPLLIESGDGAPASVMALWNEPT